MTIWRPTPDAIAHGDIKYIAIADALEQDIRDSRLAPGDRLPTHRDLADALGVTVGTVSRAYAEAQSRGLIAGEVGRGTFVRLRPDEPFAMRDVDSGGHIDLSFASPPVDDVELAPAVEAFAGGLDTSAAFRYQAHAGSARHREAGARWLARFGVTATADRVLVTAGAQHAMLVAMSTITEPGDRVLAEALTYPVMNALARLLRLRLHPVAGDGDGMRPDAFEQACAREHPRAVYLTPTLQNPTATVMPEARRREIADIAARHDVAIVEDDVYAHLVDEPPPPITAFAPSRAYYLTSLSKSVSAGLRVGYLFAPAAAVDRLTAAIMTTTIMASPVTAELATLAIDLGLAGDLVRQRRVEARERQRVARRVLGDHLASSRARPESLFVWLPLPEPWRAEELVARARAAGVLVSSPEPFVVGRGAAPHAVRVSVGAVADLGELERGLRVLAELLGERPRFGVSAV